MRYSGGQARLFWLIAVVGLGFLANYLGIFLPRYIQPTIQILSVLSAIDAVMSVKIPQSALAWALFLIVVPIVGLPLYWIFGRSHFDEYADAVRAVDQKVSERLTEHSQRFHEYVVNNEEHKSELIAEMNALATIPVTQNNDVQLIINGKPKFELVFAEIANAQQYILVEYYIVNNDELGIRLRDALIAKAKQGVRVYFNFDDIGSSKLRATFLDPMRDAGIKATAFSGGRSRFGRSRMNFRNHRKIVIVDGQVGFLGGINVGDEYLDLHKQLTPWRDTHLCVRGPVVQAMQLVFMRDWFYATEEVPELNWQIEQQAANRKGVIVATGPTDNVDKGSLFFSETIDAARKRVWIATPYFIPDDVTLGALQLAALRDVEVRVLIPRKTDNVLFHFAPYAYLHEVEKIGGQVWLYEKGFMHQKVMLIDDEVAVVGTANFDNRSFRLNFEINALFADQAFAREVAAMLTADFAQSTRLTVEEFNNRSIFYRFAARVTRLASPIL